MDKMIRRRHDPPPFIPGTDVRFEWPEPGDPDVAMLRERVQEGAPGLYVLKLPMLDLKVLAECYYPDELRDGMWRNFDPMRRADWQDGRLICMHTLNVDGAILVGGGRRGSVHAIRHLSDQVVEEIRRNNRSARRDLKRNSSATARRQELDNAEEDLTRRVSRDFEDAYAHAFAESMDFAMDKPRVSMYTPKSR